MFADLRTKLFRPGVIDSAALLKVGTVGSILDTNAPRDDDLDEFDECELQALGHHHKLFSCPVFFEPVRGYFSPFILPRRLIYLQVLSAVPVTHADIQIDQELEDTPPIIRARTQRDTTKAHGSAKTTSKLPKAKPVFQEESQDFFDAIKAFVGDPEECEGKTVKQALLRHRTLQNVIAKASESKSQTGYYMLPEGRPFVATLTNFLSH